MKVYVYVYVYVISHDIIRIKSVRFKHTEYMAWSRCSTNICSFQLSPAVLIWPSGNNSCYNPFPPVDGCSFPPTTFVYGKSLKLGVGGHRCWGLVGIGVSKLGPLVNPTPQSVFVGPTSKQWFPRS